MQAPDDHADPTRRATGTVTASSSKLLRSVELAHQRSILREESCGEDHMVFAGFAPWGSW